MNLVLEGGPGVSAYNLETSGQQLIAAAGNLWWCFYEAHHCILPATLRDAGIGLLNRSEQMRKRETTEEDVLFYSEVRNALAHILNAIESGDYAEQLERIRIAKDVPSRP